jgi:hypothetical protein
MFVGHRYVAPVLGGAMIGRACGRSAEYGVMTIDRTLPGIDGTRSSDA